MKCTKCGVDKHAYNFYLHRGKSTSVTHFFFTNPDAKDTQCWECNGAYRCICCGIEQPANQFRVGGRICTTCKTLGKYTVLAEANTRKVVESGEYSLGVDSDAGSTS